MTEPDVQMLLCSWFLFSEVNLCGKEAILGGARKRCHVIFQKQVGFLKKAV